MVGRQSAHQRCRWAVRHKAAGRAVPRDSRCDPGRAVSAGRSLPSGGCALQPHTLLLTTTIKCRSLADRLRFCVTSAQHGFYALYGISVPPCIHVAQCTQVRIRMEMKPICVHEIVLTGDHNHGRVLDCSVFPLQPRCASCACEASWWGALSSCCLQSSCVSCCLLQRHRLHG